jgi:outer membrane protein assembly factor BamB
LRQAWRFDAPGRERGLSGPVIADGLAVAVGRDGVYAVHLADGSLAWKLARGGGPKIAQPAVADVGGRSVVVFTEGGRAKDSLLRAYDLKDRKHLWDVRLQDVSASGVAVDGDRAFLGDRSGTLYAVDLKAGSILWKFNGEGVIGSPPAVADGRVYAVTINSSTNAAELVGTDESTGKGARTFAPSQLAVFGTSPTIVDGSVIVGFGDRSVYAVDGRTGASRWSSEVPAAFSPLASGARLGHDVVMAATLPLSTGTGLYRLAGTTGTRRWWFQFDSFSREGSPVVTGRFILVGLDDGRLAAVDGRTGREVWQLGTGHGEVGPIAIGGDEVVAAKGGAHGGLVGFVPDSSGHLVDVESPTVLHLGTSLLNFVVAFVGVAGVVLVAAAVVATLRGRRRGGREAEPA